MFYIRLFKVPSQYYTSLEGSMYHLDTKDLIKTFNYKNSMQEDFFLMKLVMFKRPCWDFESWLADSNRLSTPLSVLFYEPREWGSKPPEPPPSL